MGHRRDFKKNKKISQFAPQFKGADQAIQIKYARLILVISIVSGCVFVLPALFYINQNYNIFLRFSDSLSPSLANYLHREKIGFNIFFSFLFVLHTLIWVFFSRRFIASLIGPVRVLRNHIKLLSRGYFSIDPIQIRETDEFRDLVQSYNYFYALLKVHNEQELEKLKNIRDQVEQPVAKALVNQLIEDREKRVS